MKFNVIYYKLPCSEDEAIKNNAIKVNRTISAIMQSGQIVEASNADEAIQKVKIAREKKINKDTAFTLLYDDCGDLIIHDINGKTIEEDLFFSASEAE